MGQEVSWGQRKLCSDFVILTVYDYSDQIKEGEIFGVCDMDGIEEKCLHGTTCKN
jgi:hypothetical protein